MLLMLLRTQKANRTKNDNPLFANNSNFAQWLVKKSSNNEAKEKFIRRQSECWFPFEEF